MVECKNIKKYREKYFEECNKHILDKKAGGLTKCVKCRKIIDEENVEA